MVSQTIEKFSVDSGGASAASGNLQVLYTLGEVHVQESSAESIQLSEGFINPLGDGTTLNTNHVVLSEHIKVYPNPVSETINIISDETIDRIELFSVLGKLEYTADNKNQVTVDELSTGMYLLKITIGDKQVTKRIVVKR